ncbi:MAG: DMT family transporter [Clostridia bacterium]|nr:DMT family transporter [Clostridia bacterium]
MLKKPTKLQGLLLLLLVNTLWGLSFIFSKAALEEGMPTLTLAFVRYCVASCILLPICLKTEGGVRLGVWAPRALATTLLGVTVYYFFEYTGLTLTTASAASLILSLVPMMTLLYRVMFNRERISLRRWGTVALSLLGAFLVIGADLSSGSRAMLGNLLMICACLCWVGYIIISPKLMDACSAMKVTTWQALAATVTFIPFALMERESWVPISLKAWICIGILAVLCSALCYVLYGVAIRSVDSLTVSLTININPIAACIGGFLFLGERLSLVQLAGGALILLSVLLDSLLSSREKQG